MDNTVAVAVVRTPKKRWVDAGLHALAAGGPEAVRVEALARELGVTKGGFYWHFAGKRALLDEMLDTWEQRGVDEVIERVESGGGDGRTRLRRLFTVNASRTSPLRIELAVRDWARRDKSVAARVRRVDNRRMDYMRSLFGDFCADADEVEARCMVVMALFIGSRFIVADHGHRSRADVMQRIAKDLLS